MNKLLFNSIVKIFILVVVLDCFGAAAHSSARTETGYVIDAKRSFVKVSVHYALIPTMKGEFSDFKGTIHFNPHQSDGQMVDLSVKTKSIITGNDAWDRMIRSHRLLNAAKYPYMTFHSRSVHKSGGGFTVTGTVSLHGVTKEVTFPFEVIKQGRLSNQEYLMARGVWVLNRKDFDIIWNRTLDKGGVLVGDEVKIDWEIFALKPS